MPAGKRILVADDDSPVRRLIADALRDAGYHVSEASDGLEVLRCLQAEPPDFLVLDLVMPEIDGAQVCRYLKAHPQLQALPVVLLSGAATEAAAQVAELGVAAYLPKRAAAAMIPDLLRMLRALERGEPIGEGGIEPQPRRIVAELLAALARLQGILRNLGEGVLLLDTDGHILFANAAACALLRREEHFLLGAKLTAVWPETGEAIVHLLKEMKERGGMLPRRMDLSCHGRPCALALANITEDGRVVGHQLLVRDTTEAVRIEELAALNEMASLFASSLQLDDVLRRVVERSQTLLRAEAASLLLADPQGGGLVFQVASGEYGGALPGVVLPPGQGVAGWVYREGVAANVPDVSQDPRFYPGIDAKTGFRTRSSLCVPLIVQGRAIGVLEVLNSLTASGFTQTQETLLLAIAGHAAVAIENARLYGAAQQEIAVRKRMEEELRGSEERYRQLAEAAHDMIFILNRDMVIEYSNTFAARFVGRKVEELIGMKFTGLFPPEVTARQVANVQRVLDSNEPLYIEALTGLSEGVTWLGTWLVPLTDANGKPRAVLGVARDISKRKQADAVLRESEERLRLALVAANQGMYDVDVRLGVTVVSPEYATMLGYDPAEFRETTADWIERLHPDDRETVAETYRGHIRGDIPEYRAEYRQRTAAGDYRWILSLGKIVERDAEGKPLRLLGTHTDITERKQAEETTIRHARELESLRKVGEDISRELALSTVLRLIVQRAASLLDGASGILAMWDAAEGRLRPAQWEGVGDWVRDLSWELGEGLIGLVAEERRGRIVSDYRTSRFAHPAALAHAQLAALLAEPVIHHDRLIGVISIGKEEGCFAEEDRTFLSMLASQAAIAIENARLYEQVLMDLSERTQAEAAIRQQAERLRLVAELDHAILSAESPASIAQAAVERIRRLVPCHRAAMAVYEQAAGRFVNMAVDVDGPTRVPAGMAIPVGDLDPDGKVLSGAGRHIQDIQTEETLPRILRVLAEEGIRSVTTFPMVVEDRVLGAFSLYRNEVSPFTTEEREILGEVGNRLAIALERAQLFDAVSKQKEEVRALGRRLTETEESERRRISRELHDRVGQELTALSLNLSILQGQLPPTTEEKVHVRLRDSQALVDGTIAQIRNVMAELRPPVLDDYGLMATLRWYGEQFGARSGVEVMVEGEEARPRLPLGVETVLFRIAQEALTNAAKHAQASRVILRLEEIGRQVLLRISDDGRGTENIRPPMTGHAGGWGIAMMRERAEAVGGRFAIWSKPGQGTRVSVEIRRQ